MLQARAFRSAALRRFMIAVSATVVSLLAAEGIARLVAPYPMSRAWMGQINGVIAPLPNVHGRHFVPGVYDTTFSFSSQRFRGEQLYSLEPAPGAVRIAALGTSFTFGSGANDGDSYPAQLQAILQEQSKSHGGSQTFEVINAGISGSAISEQALWYENWVRQFHPTLVILNVGCAVDHFTGLFVMDSSGNVTPRSTSDVQAAARQTQSVRSLASRLPGFAFLSQHSEFFNLFRMSVGHAVSRKRDAALDAGPYPSDPDAVDGELDKELTFETAETIWLKERVEQSGARLAVTVLPCRENVYPDQSRWAKRVRREYPQVVNAFRVLSAKQNIPFTELAPALGERARHSPPLYYDGRFETHPTPAGYRAIAESVAAFLHASGVVPAITAP